ncbi:hypothetical protein AMS68_002364 [Peltaster fructicola]|uniref:Uncharacterized protein n=1 Tax=Peltaster fructicola TaxID=286661 RepID=A0A6H0XQ15_9PEZI|nr:hypothetical protein AMS68_002364 [Peltaster fructicola]
MLLVTAVVLVLTEVWKPDIAIVLVAMHCQVQIPMAIQANPFAHGHKAAVPVQALAALETVYVAAVVVAGRATTTVVGQSTVIVHVDKLAENVAVASVDAIVLKGDPEVGADDRIVLDNKGDATMLDGLTPTTTAEKIDATASELGELLAEPVGRAVAAEIKLIWEVAAVSVVLLAVGLRAG